MHFLPTDITRSIIVFGLVFYKCVASRETCALQTTDTMLSKEKTYDTGERRIKLTCVSLVSLNMCEGTCHSQATPSIMKYPNTKRDCKCCNVSEEEGQFITLDKCFDGATLVPGQHTTMFVRVPTKCNCSRCES